MKTFITALMLSVALVTPSMAQTCEPGKSLPEIVELYKNTPPVSDEVTVNSYEGTVAQDFIKGLQVLTGLPSSIAADTVVVLDQPNTGSAGILLMTDGCLVQAAGLPDQIVYTIVKKVVGQDV